jgi:undecaprenyl-diphosphatase
VNETTGSFPSGHAVAGAVVAISLVIVLIQPGPARRNLEIAAAGFAFLMAGTRLYLGAHWLTDVFGGVAFGAACAIGAAAIVQRYIRAKGGYAKSRAGPTAH